MPLALVRRRWLAAAIVLVATVATFSVAPAARAIAETSVELSFSFGVYQGSDAHPARLTATVTPSTATGTASFYFVNADGSIGAKFGPAVTVVDGLASYGDVPLQPGVHLMKAVFVPTAYGEYTAAVSLPVRFRTPSGTNLTATVVSPGITNVPGLVTYGNPESGDTPVTIIVSPTPTASFTPYGWVRITDVFFGPDGTMYQVELGKFYVTNLVPRVTLTLPVRVFALAVHQLNIWYSPTLKWDERGTKVIFNVQRDDSLCLPYCPAPGTL